MDRERAAAAGENERHQEPCRAPVAVIERVNTDKLALCAVMPAGDYIDLSLSGVIASDAKQSPARWREIASSLRSSQ